MTGPSVFGAGWEEGKAAALYRPFIHAYATSTLMGENTPSNAGSAWQWPRYATAEYRRSGAFGATKGNRWTSGAKPEAGPWQSFVQLVYNGRQRPISAGPDSADAEYLAARAALERVWREHGQSETEYGGLSFFYDQHFLPAAQNATGLLIGRSPMPIASVVSGNASDGSSRLALRTFRPLRSGGAIRYTLDGCAVTASSAVYREALALGADATLRAATFEPLLTPSRELAWTTQESAHGRQVK